MANRYWVGGTGTWTTTTTNWSATSGGASGASAPTSADSVFFDQAGTYTVTMTGTLNCLDITVSAGTVTFTSTGNLFVAGSMTLSSSTVWSATGTLTFSSTATGRTITTNNITINAATVTFNGSGGAWTLGSSFTTATTTNTSYLTGTLNLVTFTWSTGIFTSSSALTRVISFGSGNIALTSTAGTTVLNMTDITGFSWTGTGGFTSAHGASNLYRFTGVNATASTAPNLSITGGSVEVLIYSASYFKKLDFTGNTSVVSGSTTGSATSLNLQSLTLAGGTYTNVTALMIAGGTIDGNGKTIAALNINTGGTTTLSSALTVTGTTTFGTSLASALTLSADLTTGSFSASSSLTRSIAFGVNFIITTTSGITMPDMTNFTWTGSAGGFKGNMAVSAQTFSLGSVSGVTATNAVNLYIYTGAQNVFLTTLSRFNKVDCTGSTSIVNCSSASTPGIVYFNSLILASGGTYTTIQASMVGDASGGTTSTISGNGSTTLNTIFIAAGLTTTLTSALGISTYTQITNTTLNTDGFALTATSTVTYTGGTLTLNGSNLSCTTFTLNGPTFVHNSGTITCSTAFTLTSGSFTLGTLGNLSAIPTFNHTAGTATFLKSTAFAVTGTYTFSSGTLAVSGVTLSVGIFNSSTDLVRVLTFGTGFIDLTHTTADTIVLGMVGGTGFSCTGAGGFSSSMNNSRRFRVTTNHTISNAPNLFITGGANNVLIDSGSFFNNLNFTGSTSTVSGNPAASATTVFVGSITLATGGTYTLVTVNQQATGTISGNGRTVASLSINTAGLTTTISTALTVTGTTTWGSGITGTLILSADLTTGSFSAAGTSTRSISFGANYIVMTTNGLAMSVADNFTWTGTGGFKGNMSTTNQSFNFGSTSGGSASNAPNILIYTGAFSAFLTASSHFKTVDCTGSTSQVNASSSTILGAINVYDSVVLASGGTYPFLQLDMKATTNTINGNGRTLGTFTIASGSTTTLLSALTINTAYTQVTGTTLALGSFTLTQTASTFTYTGGTLSMGTGTISCITFTFNGPTFTLNSGTITCSSTFNMTTGSFTLDTGGTLIAIPTFNHTAGTVTFLKSTAFATTGTYNFSSGTLAVSGVTLSVGIFNSSTDLVRVLTFGTGFIDLTHTTADTIVLSMTAGTGFSCTGAGGFSSSMNNTRRFRVTTNHTISNAPNLFITGGASNVLIDSSSVFNNLSFTGSTSTVSGSTAGSALTVVVGSITLASGGTYLLLTVNQQATGTISGNGRTIASLSITTAGLTTTISTALTVTGTTTWGSGNTGTLILSADLTTGSFSAAGTSVRSISFGANYIVMTTNGLAMSVADNFTWTGTGGFKGNMTTSTQSFNFGATSGASSANAPNMLIYTGANTASLTTSSHFKTLDCTGSTSQVNASSGVAIQAINVYDSVVLASGGTYPWLQLDMKATTNTINGNGRTLGGFTIASGSTTTLLSALTINSTYTQVTGTTLALGSFTLTSTAGTFTYTGGTLTMGTGTISCITFTLNGPTFTLSSGTINCSSTFNMTTGSFTLGTSGNLGAIPTFNHTAGTVTFLKSTAFATTGTYTFTTGTLDVSGVTLSVGIFSSNSGVARTLTFGTGFINLTHSTAGTIVLEMGDCTLVSPTGTGGFTSNMSVQRGFRYGYNLGGAVATAVNLSLTTGAGEALITSASWFKTLDCTSSTSTISGATTASATTLNLQNLTLAGGTYTNLTATMQTACTIVGNSKTIAALNLNTSGAVVITGALTVTGTCTYATSGTATSLSLSADLTVGTFSSSSTVTRSIAFGANYIITTTSGVAISVADNFTYTGAGGFKGNMGASAQSFTFGVTSGASASNAPNLLIYTGANTATISAASWFKTIDCTGSTSVVNTTSVNVNALTLASGGTYTAFTAIVYGTSSINGNGKTIVTFTFSGTSDTCSLQSALALSGAFTIGSTNTLNLATFTFAVTGAITCNTSSSIINFGTTSCTTFTIAGPNITVNSGALNCTSFTITSGTYTLGASGAMAATVGIFTHTAGNVTFLKSYALTATGTYNFTAGTLTLTGFTLSTGIFSSNNTNVRNLIINTGFISLTHTTAGTTVVSMADTTNLTCTCTTGGFTSDASTTRTFTYGTTGGLVDNVANLTLTGSGTNIITLTTGSWFKNLSFGSTAFNPGATTLNLSGFALATGGTYTSMNITLRGSDNNTVNGNAKTIGPLTINKTGTTTFQSALSCSTLTQTAGDINFATFNLTCSSTVAFTAGTYTNMGVLQCTTFTLNGIFTLSSGTLTPTVSFVLGSGTFTYQTPGTLSAVATFTHTAGSATFSKAYALTATGTYTLTAGDLILNGVDLSTGIFSSTGAGIRSIQFGTNNIVLTHTTAAQTVINMADVSNLTVTGTGGFNADALVTRTYSYGSTSGGSATNSANLLLTGAGTAIATITTGSWFNTLNFNATAFAIAVTTVNINAITLSSGGTFTNLTVQMRGTGLITTNNKTIAGFVLDTIGTNTLAGNVTCTSYTQTAGLLNLATFNILCSGAIIVTGGSMLNSGTITCTTFTVNGTFSLDSGTITPSVSVVVQSGSFTYNSGGTLSPVPTFTHTAGTFTLGKAYSLTATGTYTFTAGAINLGGFNLTTGIFSSSGTSTRSIDFGTGNIVLAHTTAAQTVLAMADATSFTNAGTGGFTSEMTVARTFTFGTTGGAFNIAPNLAITGGVQTPTITTGSWFKTLNFTGSSTTPPATTLNIDTLILSSGGTYTGLTPHFTRSQTWTAQFSKQLGGIGINALFNTLTLDNTQTYIPTSVCSVIAGNLNLGGADLTIGSFSAPGTLTRSVIFGSSNIILSTPTAAVTVLSVADATNFSCSFVTGGFVATSAITRTFTFGTTGGTSLSAPNLTINSGSAIPTITTGSWFNILDFTGSSCTPSVATLNVNSAILSSGGTFTNLSLTMRSNGSITPLGKTISAFVVNHTDLGTTTIVSTLNCTTQTYTAGNVDFNNSNVTSSAGAAYSSGAFSNINTITCTTFTVTGAFTLFQGTIAPSVSIILTSGSITYTGGTINAVPTFTHTSGTFILGKAYALTATGTYTLTGGSIVLNGYNLTTGIFSSTGIVSRSISFSTGNINLTHTTAAQTVLNMADVTNFTQSATTGGFVSDASVTRTFTFGTTGGTVTNAPNLAITTGSAVATITTLSWFNTLTFDGSSTTPPAATINVSTLILSVGGTYTGLVPVFTRTQTWTPQFSKQLGGIGFNLVGGTLTLEATQTYTATSQGILTAGTINLGGVDLTIGTFSSNNSNVRSLVLGSNNIILSTTTAAATNLDMATATNFTISGTGGFTAAASTSRTFSFGSTAGGTATNSPNLTFTGSGTAIQTTTTASWFNKLDFGSTAFTASAGSLNLNSLTLSSTGSFVNLAVTMVGSGTIISNGATNLQNLTVSGTGITTTLGSAFTLTGSSTGTGNVQLDAGTLALAGFILTCNRFIAGVQLNARSISFGTGNIVLAINIAGAIVISISDATNFTWTGTGGFTTVMDVSRQVNFGSTAGGSATNAINLSVTGGASGLALTSGGWFKNLNFTGSTCAPAGTINVDTLTLATGGTYASLTPVFTRTQTWTVQFSQQLGGIGVNGSGVTLTLSAGQTYLNTSQCLLTLGTINLGGSDLEIGSFVSNNTNVRSLVLGSNNIILNSPTVGAVNIDMAIATNFTISGTGGFTTTNNINKTFTFGTTGGSATNSPNLTFTGGSAGTGVVTLTTGSWFNTLNFGVTSAGSGSTTLNLNSVTLSPSGTYTGLAATMVATGTITTNSKPISSLTINHSGTTTLNGIFSGGINTSTLTSGTLNLAGFTLTTGTFSSSNTNTRSISFGVGNIELAAATSGLINLDISTATGFTWTGTGGFTAIMSFTRTFTFGSTVGGSSTNAPNLSLTSGASVPTITTGSWFNTLNFTGSTCTPAATTLNLMSLTLASGGTYTSLTATMVGTGSITSAGKTIAALTINHTGTTTLSDALTVGATAATTLTSGTLALAGFTLTTGTFVSSNTNTRSITFGAGNISLTTSSAGQVLNMGDATNFTWTGTGTVGFTTEMSVSRTFAFGYLAGGSATNAPNLSLTSGASSLNFFGGSWFNTLNFTGTTSAQSGGFTSVNVDTLILATGGTYSSMIVVFTRTQTWTAQFSKQLGGIGVNGSGVTLTLDATQTYAATSQCLLTAGTINLGGANLTIGTFVSNNTNVRSLVFGSNNVILSTTTAGSNNLDMANATNFTWTGTGGFTSAMSTTRTFSFGNTAGGSASNAPNLSLTSGASIPTITSGSWFKTLSFTGSTCAPVGTVNVDTLTLATGGTYTGLVPVFTRTQTWTPQFSKQLGGIGVNGSGVTLTLESTQTYSLTSTLIVNAGTLDISTLTFLFFNSFSSTGTGSRSIAGTGTINISGNWTVTSGSGFTGSSYTINIYGSTFAGGGGSYGTLVQKSQALTITGSNSFVDIENVWQNPSILADVLVVAGGGAGGYGRFGNHNGGGGGAGGVRSSLSAILTLDTYAITIGGGGALATNGSDSSILGGTLNITSSGGGLGGGAASPGGPTPGFDGGSGGGGAGSGSPPSPRAGGIATPVTSPVQGYAGGIGYGTGYPGGGGGASQVGFPGTPSTGPSGIGGAGINWNSLGSFYGGGGGGQGVAGGAGGGGAGGTTGSGVAGTPNTGGGGGGGSAGGGGVPGTGGSGVVVIRYPDSYAAATSTTGSPVIDVSGGYRTYTFTATGTITF